MRLLKTDLYEIFNACIGGTLSDINIEWTDDSACCIVLASKGYPQSSQKGISITIPHTLETDIEIFHAATKKQDNDLITNGGRVLGVTATDKTLPEALKKAYKTVHKINFDGMQFRTDIGFRKKPTFTK